MSIINFTSARGTEFVEGAYCPLSYFNTPSEVSRADGCGGIVLWESEVGLCLSMREANYYDDSDFYMLVWNPVTESAEEIMYATTRGWSYPAMGSFVDATPEVRAAYEAWREKKKAEAIAAGRAKRAKMIRAARANEVEIAGKNGITVIALRKWKYAERPDLYERALPLLTSKLRSNFRISLREQLLNFLKNGGKYRTPFSMKQWDYV